MTAIITIPDVPKTSLPTARPSLAGLSRGGLATRLTELGIAPKHTKMRVQQLWRWLYVEGVTAFEPMTDISMDLRRALDAAFTLSRPEIVTEQVSNDGT